MWLPLVPLGVGHGDSHLEKKQRQQHGHPRSSSSLHEDAQQVEHGHGDSEPVVVKKITLTERLAEEMKKSGIDCEVQQLGSHTLEHLQSYYSHTFALSSRLVTNRGLIKVKGRNIDYVQVLQRS